MERLTVRDNDNNALLAWELEGEYTPIELIDLLVNRLADYEDSGLEPQEIKSLQAEWEVSRQVIDSLRAQIAEAAPVVHGTWRKSDFIPGMLTCNQCGAQRNPNFKIGGGTWSYCPNCGAKMDGGDT